LDSSARDEPAGADAVRVADADESHLEAIRAIRNEVVANTTAIYEDDEATPGEIVAWFAHKRERACPVLVALAPDGRVMGFSSYDAFNSRPGYRYTVEHAVHVAADWRGRGVGRTLLRAIESRAREAGVRVMIGLIDQDNAGSRRLHESEGFELAGTLRGVGRKFGRWLDMCLYEKRIH